MDTLLGKLAAHAPRDFVVGDHVLADVRSKARQAVVLGSEGEGLIRVRVLKDNSVATVNACCDIAFCIGRCVFQIKCACLVGLIGVRNCALHSPQS